MEKNFLCVKCRQFVPISFLARCIFCISKIKLNNNISLLYKTHNFDCDDEIICQICDKNLGYCIECCKKSLLHFGIDEDISDTYIPTNSLMDIFICPECILAIAQPSQFEIQYECYGLSSANENIKNQINKIITHSTYELHYLEQLDYI